MTLSELQSLETFSTVFRGICASSPNEEFLMISLRKVFYICISKIFICMTIIVITMIISCANNPKNIIPNSNTVMLNKMFSVL